MKIDDDILNSKIEYCIDEYVRLIEHREMLREFWFQGMTIAGIAEKHNISETSVKRFYTILETRFCSEPTKCHEKVTKIQPNKE